MEGLERISDAYEDKDIIATMIYYKNPVHHETPDDIVIFQQTFNEAFIPPPNVDEENANREVAVKNSDRTLKSILLLFAIAVIICIIVYYLVLY